MSNLNQLKRYIVISILGGLLISPLLSSCGSDINTAGIGGTGITQGEITAFGSVFVNGVEFDTDSTTFDVDGQVNFDQSNLRVGMVVTIVGNTDSNGVTGTADSVAYDDKLQGPVAAIDDISSNQKTLTIFNKKILIENGSTEFEDTTFADIVDNDIVEISGFDTTTGITASYLKRTGRYPGDIEVELRGTITSLTTSSFLLDGISVSYDSNTDIELPGGNLSEGLYVEVEGELDSISSIFAEEIEFEDDEFDEGLELSLQGVISQYYNLSNFNIDGQQINASGASISPSSTTLTAGTNVEVQGDIVNGILIAEQVEVRD
ncbi:MAG: hypothetical protein GY820_07815 [Gammaproteobacteria bacterium]|nr:hypothetical protein [Gammaproteobacteria bacterium]